MIVYSYYLEIKNRLILLSLGWLSTILVSYAFKEILLFIIAKQSVIFINSSKDTFYYIFTNVTEIFHVYVTLIFFTGNQITILYLFYHSIVFIIWGLYKPEYKYLGFILKICCFFFFFSIAIFNKVLFSFSWDFFSSFQNFITLKSLNLHFETKLDEYVKFYVTSHYICILYFQIFLLFIFLFDCIGNQLRAIQKFRKLFYYSFFMFSTLVTPPDVSSQIILSCSIIFSYETLMFCIILKKKLRSNH